jgi:hypothetical protein
MKLAWSTVVLSLVVVGCADERAPTDDVGKGAPPPPPIASRCQGPAFCDGAACAPTTAAISEVACQCALLDPSCGTGVCIEGAYCEGFGCPNPVCYDVDSTISQAMCNGAALAGCALDCVAPAGEVALWPLDETATTAAYTVEWNPDDQSGGNRTQFAWAIQYVPPQRGVTALGFSAAWTGTWTGIAGTALRVELFDSATAAWTPVHTAAGPGPVSLADLQVGFAPLAVVTAIRFITIDVNTQLPVATVDFQNFVGGTFHLAQDVALRPKDLAGRNNGTALDTLQHHTASGSAGPVPAAGRARGALAFDGLGDVVIAPLHYDENSPGARATHNYGSVTASAWINLAQVTAPSRAVVAFTDRASGKIAYALEVTGSELTFRYRLYTASGALAGTFAQTTSGAGLTAGTWHHVAVSASNNGGVRYYVDGVQVATGTLALTGTMIGDQWQLGSAAGVGAPAPSFLGRIDEVKIYDRALPSGELLLAYNAGGGTCYPDVIVEVPHDGEVFEGANPNRTVAVAGHASSPGQQLAIEGHVGGASWTPLTTAVASSTLDASGMYPWSTTITAPSSWPETGLGWIRATVWNQPLPAATVDDPLCLGRHAALGARDRVATCRGDHGPMVTLTDGDAVGQPIGSPALFPRSEPNPAGTLRYLWRKLYLGSSSGAQPVQPQPSAYYAAVGAGPSQPRSTMTGFLGVNGFPPVWPGAEIRARYFNAGDLRVGRDMHCREVTACDGTAPLCTTGSPACGVVVPPLWQLVQGSEGSGKTYALAMWCGLRVLEHVGHDREIGITAPVTKRMRHVQNAIRKTWPAHWYRWREVLHQYQFRAGPTVQLVSAHTSRSDEGSPIQGANWVAHGGDELQDHFDKEDDIVMRGRSAPDGRYKRLNTSTAKDSAAWRDFRRVVEGSPVWRFAKMLGTANPLVSPEHWARLRAGGMTQREWDRRVLALDVPPEKQLYYNWRRTNDDGTPANLMPIPIGAVDVTADVLASYGRRIGVLVGHDPGTLQHVSMFLKAYKLTPRDRHYRWFVVDEVTSPESTVRAHVADVLKRLQEHHGCNLTDWKGRPSESSPVALVRIDPHTQTGTEHPGRDLYTVWRQFGLIALAAAYQPGTTKPQTIKKESRFDLMNVLLCDDVGGAERRLLVACNDRGAPAAPRLVSAFESLERNEAGEGEADGKGKGDLSHWPAAVGYAVWQVERPRAPRSHIF